MIPDDVYLIRDTIPLEKEENTIEGRAERVDVYPVTITTAENRVADSLAEMAADRRVMLITDDTLLGLHGGELIAALRGRGIDVEFVSVPPGERSKDLAVAVKLLDRLAHSALGRPDLVVAFGGGMVIDVVGWVASDLQRRLPDHAEHPSGARRLGRGGEEGDDRLARAV
ncbi:MAG TPA: iron-containing alcohol dehydrogenase [Trebonia sp.]|nr:iron-containing alcohol dehydrogenase [Trebonia sp.]